MNCREALRIAAAGHEPTGFATSFKDERHARSQPPPPILRRPGQLPLIGRTKGSGRIDERLKTQGPEHRFVPDYCTPDLKLHIGLARAGRVERGILASSFAGGKVEHITRALLMMSQACL